MKKSLPSSSVSGSSNSCNSSSISSSIGSRVGTVVVVTPVSMLGSKNMVVVVELLVVVITGIVEVVVGVASSQLVNLLNRPTVL